MPLHSQFANELVADLTLLHQRPFNGFTRQLTRASLAASLVQLLGAHKLDTMTTFDMVDIVAHPTRPDRAAAEFKLPKRYAETLEIATLLGEAFPEYMSRTEGDTVTIAPVEVTHDE